MSKVWVVRRLNNASTLAFSSEEGVMAYIRKLVTDPYLAEYERGVAAVLCLEVDCELPEAKP